MRITCTLLLFCLASYSLHGAEGVAIPIERVHICCDECVEGVRSAVTSAGATDLLSDQDTSRLVIFAPDTATAKRAVKAMVDAGYFGRSRNPEVPITADTGAKDATVKSTEIEGVHLCCSSCVEQAKGALVAVPGVKSVEASTHQPTIQIKGEFNEKAALDALLDVGFAGKTAARQK
jgi:copper chaperone CopZ